MLNFSPGDQRTMRRIISRYTRVTSAVEERRRTLERLKKSFTRLSRRRRVPPLLSSPCPRLLALLLATPLVIVSFASSPLGHARKAHTTLILRFRSWTCGAGLFFQAWATRPLACPCLLPLPVLLRDRDATYSYSYPPSLPSTPHYRHRHGLDNAACPRFLRPSGLGT
jgi:hypothetical protein